MAEDHHKLNVNHAALDQAVQRLQRLAQGDEKQPDPFALIFEYDLTQGESVEFDAARVKALDDNWNQNTANLNWTPEQRTFAHQVATAYWQIFNLHHRMFNANITGLQAQGMQVSDGVFTATMQDRELIVELNKLLTGVITRNALREIQRTDGEIQLLDDQKAIGFLGKIIRYSMQAFQETDNKRAFNHSVTSVFPQYVHRTAAALVQEAMGFPDTKLQEIEHMNIARLDTPVITR